MRMINCAHCKFPVAGEYIMPCRKEAAPVLNFNAKLRRALLASAATTFLVLSGLGAGPTFTPDTTFKGSTLAGWHPLGDASWRAEDGVVIGTPKSASGG